MVVHVVQPQVHVRNHEAWERFEGNNTHLELRGQDK